MRMKFAPLTLAVLVAGLPLASLAQSAPPPAPVLTAPAAQGEHHHGGHGHMMKMLSELSLTADQKSKIDGYVAASKTANANRTDPQVRHANMKALRDQIVSVLTPDQKTQLEAKMKAARQNGPPKPQ